MTDEHQQPGEASGDTPPDLTKTPATAADRAPGQAEESIWQRLDGSGPVAPATPPATFERPAPTPLAWPPAPEPVVDAQTGQAVFTLAGWGSRLGAYLLDAIIFGSVLLTLSVSGGVALGLSVEESLMFFGGLEMAPEGVDTTPLWVLFGLQLLLQGTLPAVFLARWNGQTPGKRIARLRVVREGGEPMTLGVALRRELVAKTVFVGLVGSLTFGIVFLANYLWPLRDAQNRAGHDFYAKTRVVTVPRG